MAPLPPQGQRTATTRHECPAAIANCLRLPEAGAVSPATRTAAIPRADMKTHLDQTLAEAAHELHGQYATSVSDYEAIRTHILMMADQLSTGIVAQFSSRFR
jgi:hypothetical protein